MTDQGDDGEAGPTRFPEGDDDLTVYAFARDLAAGLAGSPLATDEQKAALRQAAADLERLPEPKAAGRDITFGVGCGNYHRDGWAVGWQVSFTEQELYVDHSRVVDSGVGSDTESSFGYWANVWGDSSLRGDVFDLFGRAAELCGQAERIDVEAEDE